MRQVRSMPHQKCRLLQRFRARIGRHMLQATPEGLSLGGRFAHAALGRRWRHADLADFERGFVSAADQVVETHPPSPCRLR